MKFSIGFSLIIIWFLIGFIFVVGGILSERFFNFIDSYPNLPLIYYLSWFPVIIIAGLLIIKSKNK